MNIDLDLINKTRRDLMEVSRKIFSRGLTSGVSGNLSARLPGYCDRLLVKASGKCLGDVSENDFVLVDLEGNPLDGSVRPSIEVRFHCGIYKIRSEVNAIVHGHSPFATAYVYVKGELPVVTAAYEAGLNKIGIIEYEEPGSQQLAERVIDAFRDQNLKAAVMKGHGFITVGTDIFQAYYLADALEDNAKVAAIIAQINIFD